MMKHIRIGRRDPKHSALSRSTCNSKHHVDDTTSAQLAIIATIFAPVYMLSIIGMCLGWF